MPKLRHIAIAAKDPDAMAEFYVKAFDFKIVRSNDGPLAYGHHLSDGTIDLAILRFKTDQLGRGLDYTGLHHFGVLVEDVDEAAKKLESLGGRHYMDQSEAERIGGFEVNFYGPRAFCSTWPSIRGLAPSRSRSRASRPNSSRPKPPNSRQHRRGGRLRTLARRPLVTVAAPVPRSFDRDLRHPTSTRCRRRAAAAGLILR